MDGIWKRKTLPIGVPDNDFPIGITGNGGTELVTDTETFHGEVMREEIRPECYGLEAFLVKEQMEDTDQPGGEGDE